MAEISNTPEFLSLKEARRLQAKLYFTGKPCKRGHISQRYVCSRCCTICAEEKGKRDFLDRREHHREKSKRWYSNRERARKKTAAWRAKNPERERQNRRAWQKANAERVRQLSRLWTKNNPGKARKRTRNWYYRNVDSERIRCALKSAIRRSVEGSFTRDDVSRMLKQQNGKCAFCRTNLKKNYHIDHIVPIAKGGTSWPKNLQILCANCNLSKSARDPIDFAQSQGMLL